MKNLDHLLRDPRAHHAEVSSNQVQAWGEDVLLQWNAESEKAQASQTAHSRSMLASALYWGSLAAASIMLGSLLWDSLALPLDDLRTMPLTFFTAIAEHSTWLAAGVVCMAVWLTRPLRELLLD